MRLTPVRKSGLFISFLAACCLVLVLFALHASFRIRADRPSLEQNLALVRSLGLTDLCLFTEARYTRNPSQADYHAAFQDHPMALEHFPAGSLVMPPRGKLRMQN